MALLDGDSWVYRCGFAAEKTHYLVINMDGEHHFENHKDAHKFSRDQGGLHIWSRKEVEPLENCLQMVKTSLENTLNVLGTSEYRLYLSGRRSFRDDIYPDYKGNRDGASKPKYYRDIRDYILGKWRGIICEGIEADDAIGIAASDLGSSAIVVAVDKDLDQVPGRHYNWTSGETYDVSPREGMRFFYQQLLSGDPTDNIPGIRGIGPAKAAKALVDCTTPSACAEVVWDMYAKGPGETLGTDELEKLVDRNAHLIWIRRKENDSHPFWRHLGINAGGHRGRVSVK